MAQTSSAAREPSMEEILASIRRIIEDSDVSRKTAPGAPAFTPRGEIAAFRRPEPVEEKPSVAEAEEKPAMMRGIFTEEPVLRGPVDEPSLPETDEDEDEVVLDAQNDDRIVEPEEDVPAEEAGEIAPPMAEEAVIEHEAADEPEIEAETGGSGILSEAVGRQVAEAFEDLNHAVHAGPRRSFDDIAAELLRPMLQDWLDQNLPGLVERLVREEIERVVRGSR